VRLNARGTAVTASESLHATAATAAAMAGDAYYFLAANSGGPGLSFRSIPTTQ
jgi:hypothetical protein